MNTDSFLANPTIHIADQTRWYGAVEGLHADQLIGWAFDRTRPNTRVVIEVCLDGLPVASVVADVARTDLAKNIQALTEYSDICHGFVADLGTLPESTRGVLTCRIANTDVMLIGAVPRSSAGTAPASATSTVFGDGGLRLQGWALDPADPKRVMRVRAFVANDLIAETVANIIHPFQRAYIAGSHGFELALPASLADGQPHSVRLMDDEGREINGSPVSICCVIEGLSALLPSDSDDLLRNVADYYERLLPRSLPMDFWSAWSARFDAVAPPALPNALVTLKIGVLITGVQDERMIQRTTDSLGQQSVSLQFFTGENFSDVLANALSAHCDIVTCVRAGDTLLPHALAHALEGFILPDAHVVYTDSEQGECPWLKPAWNLDYALATDYPLELLLVSRTMASGIPTAHDPAAFAWCALTAAMTLGTTSIIHVPRVLYRMNSPLTDLERQCRALAAADAIGALEPLTVLENLDSAPFGITHAARRVRAVLPPDARNLTVSLVIPTRDRADLLKRCIDSIRRFTDWPKLEIIVIDNGSTDPVSHTYFKEIEAQGVRILSMPGPFNYADLNNRAVELACGEIVGLVNNDIEALHNGWLDEIVAQLLRPNVGAVGAKLMWPNGMVQHGGVLLGVGNVAGHFGNRLADADWGDHGRNQVVQQVSGCTAACLFLRKLDFLELGGMDIHAFPVAFNDVDLCLKVRASGKTIVWTPYAKLLHAESASRGHEDTPQKRSRAQREIAELRRKWGHVLLCDPAYHPSANLDPNGHAFGGLALPPRARIPRNGNLPA